MTSAWDNVRSLLGVCSIELKESLGRQRWVESIQAEETLRKAMKVTMCWVCSGNDYSSRGGMWGIMRKALRLFYMDCSGHRGMALLEGAFTHFPHFLLIFSSGMAKEMVYQGEKGHCLTLPEYSVLLEGLLTWMYSGLACLRNPEPNLFLSVLLQWSVAFMGLIRDTTFKLY